MWFGKNGEMPRVVVITSRGNTIRFDNRIFGLWNISDEEFSDAMDDPCPMPAYNKKPFVPKYENADIDTIRSELEKHFDGILNK